ncbi:hypothetical protein [Streptomyces gardneri]|uniref:hypothetical protein n=1 Tax=Streptomyces gardneri TaxID=66892 RepID=UPI0036BA4014
MRLSDLLSGKDVTVKARGGETIGQVTAIHVARDQARPVLIQVRQGSRLKILPLTGAKIKEGEVTLAYTFADIKTGPASGTELTVTARQADEAFTHYGIRVQVTPQKSAQRRVAAKKRKKARKAAPTLKLETPAIISLDWDDDIEPPQPIEPSFTKHHRHVGEARKSKG